MRSKLGMLAKISRSLKPAFACNKLKSSIPIYMQPRPQSKSPKQSARGQNIMHTSLQPALRPFARVKKDLVQ